MRETVIYVLQTLNHFVNYVKYGFWDKPLIKRGGRRVNQKNESILLFAGLKHLKFILWLQFCQWAFCHSICLFKIFWGNNFPSKSYENCQMCVQCVSYNWHCYTLKYTHTALRTSLLVLKQNIKLVSTFEGPWDFVERTDNFLCVE